MSADAAKNRARVAERRRAEGGYHTAEDVGKLCRALEREKEKRRGARQELAVMREGIEVAIESLRALLPETADAARERDLQEENANLRAQIASLRVYSGGARSGKSSPPAHALFGEDRNA